jgi:DNA-binding transcriptional LysR family regulator
VLVAAGSDLVATIPASMAMRGTIGQVGVEAFDLPLDAKPLAIGQAWHPRLDADAAHRWLRMTVREMCKALTPRRQGSPAKPR